MRRSGERQPSEQGLSGISLLLASGIGVVLVVTDIRVWKAKVCRRVIAAYRLQSRRQSVEAGKLATHAV